MTKKRRVPEVLWRVYGNRARTLADTVISLLPPPPSSAVECRCKGRRCLGCSGADALSFLLTPDDPSDYHKLLTQCFAVVSNNSPRLTVFYPDSRWSQRQIVRRTIEMIMCESHMPPNVICNGYNKCTRSSHVMDLFTTSAWSLFLTRIGDEFMVHLLKFASIFLPLPRKNHHQVAGSPISDLCPKLSKHVSGSAYRPPLPVQSGTPRKRKRTDNEDKSNSDIIISAQQPGSSLGFDNPLRSVTCHVGCNHRSCIRQISWKQRRKHSQMSFSEGNVLKTCNEEENSKGVLKQNSVKDNTKSRKHLRPFSWQRRRKRRQLNCLEENVLATCITTGNDKENLTGKLQQSSNTLLIHSKMMVSQCFCCLMLQAPQKFASQAQINRKSMFYKFDHVSSLFPRNHILYTLKPNDTGAIFLMKDIFGLSDESLSTQSISCFHNCGFCLTGSACLYHSLLELLKSLIRKARGCQYSKLLDKHCMISSLVPFAKGEAGSMLEGNESRTNLSEKGHSGFQQECNLPLEKSYGHDSRQQEKYCKKTLRTCDHQFEPSGSYCLKNQVVSFIWAVCRSIVPPDLLGAPSNWRALRRNISKFIWLRKFEKFCLKQCMHGLKTSNFLFVSNKHSSCHLSTHVAKDVLGKGANICNGCSEFSDAKIILKNKLFASWIYWFFSCLVVPIVQANFYVTESEVGKLDIFYYRKQIWEKLTSRAIACLKKDSYRLLDDTSFRRIISKRPFGFSKVRFCPKENGVRALANLKAPSKVPVQKKIPFHKSSLKDHFSRMRKRAAGKFDYFKPVNCVLRDLYAVLKGIKMKHPEKLGSSVFDYNDVYKKLCPFLSSLKSGSKTMPSLFFVICDVSKAFDSVNQDKLLSVMKDVMLNDEYLIKWSSQVVCTKKGLWVHYDPILLDQNISTRITKSTVSVPFHSLHGVLINQETSRKIRKDELYHDLCEHVKHNVLQVGQNFYLQEVGIPQGSVLSSLLCSFYYAHQEMNVIFPFLEKIDECRTSEPAKGDSPGRHISQNDDAADNGAIDDSSPSHYHMLLRFIDDFLFISTSKKQAASFFSRVQRGFREYNCSINEAKSCMNFDMDHGLSSNRVYTGEDGISFLPWSGLLINCCTLEIQADYTRYLDNHLSSTLTVCCQGKPGRHLKEKLCLYMRPKCHPVFYDSNINSAPVVRLNIYQAFLLCAMKYHCYVCNLSNVCTLHAEYHFEMIQSSLRYMHKLIMRRMHSKNLGSDVSPILSLKKKEVEWLGLNAYIRVLRRKQSRHTELLSLLRSELLTHGIKASASLKYAVDDSHSSLFWKIKY